MTHYPHPPSRAQNGSILVQFALLAVVLIAILGTVQIGYMYSAKRDLQRIADMAALESANAITNHTTCSDAKYAGNQSLSAQWPLGVTAQSGFSEMIECGSWTRANGFKNTGPFNAAKVTVSGESLQLLPFTGNRTITATATAAIANDPIAAFSIGSGIARLNGGLLNNLLSMLLGTKVDLSLVDYEGLANAKVNLLWLTNALELNAGNYDQLLNTKVSLDKLLNASIKVAENIKDSDTASIGINALNNLLKLPIGLDLDNIFISLLKGDNQNGLLDLGLYSNAPASALQADVSLLNILTTGLQIANADSGVALQTTVNLGLLAKVALALKIIEPPVIAVGKAGKDSNGNYYTTAHNGQVRVHLAVNALNALTASGNLLDLNLLLLRLKISLPTKSAIELPIYVEVGSADGRLESISCNAQGPNVHEATIGAKPGIAHLLLGHAPGAMTNTSTEWKDLPKEFFHLINIRVYASLLADLVTLVDLPLQLSAKLDLSIAPPSYHSHDFTYTPNLPRSEQDLIKTVGTESQLGASIAGALNKQLLELNLDTDGLKLLGIDMKYLSSILDGLVNSLATILGAVLSLLSDLLKPILSLLDQILGPLLKALGLQIGYADVELISVDCTAAQLVD